MVFTEISMIPRNGYQHRYTKRPINIFWPAQGWIKVIQQQNKPDAKPPTDYAAHNDDEGTIRSSGFGWEICRIQDAKLLTLLFFLKIFRDLGLESLFLYGLVVFHGYTVISHEFSELFFIDRRCIHILFELLHLCDDPLTSRTEGSKLTLDSRIDYGRGCSCRYLRPTLTGRMRRILRCSRCWHRCGGWRRLGIGPGR